MMGCSLKMQQGVKLIILECGQPSACPVIMLKNTRVIKVIHVENSDGVIKAANSNNKVIQCNNKNL
jgi:hypothetical protein